MEESSDPSRNTQYFCAMCSLMSDQISHHKAHLKTQKHIFKKKCFEQCVKMTTFHFYNSNHNNIDAIKNFEDDTGQKYEKHNEESRKYEEELCILTNKYKASSRIERLKHQNNIKN